MGRVVRDMQFQFCDCRFTPCRDIYWHYGSDLSNVNAKCQTVLVGTYVCTLACMLCSLSLSPNTLSMLTEFVFLTECALPHLNIHVSHTPKRSRMYLSGCSSVSCFVGLFHLYGSGML